MHGFPWGCSCWWRAAFGIVNAFSANLDARRRQIGLLRAVGATRRQIKRIFGRETLILAAISVPVGLGLAVLTVILIFALLGENYILVLNLWVLLGVALLSVACIKLASGIPLRRAAAVSTMQAIRDVDLDAPRQEKNHPQQNAVQRVEADRFAQHEHLQNEARGHISHARVGNTGIYTGAHLYDGNVPATAGYVI